MKTSAENIHTFQKVSSIMSLSRHFVEGRWWTYPQEAQTWVGWDNTCGSPCHSRHRTGADPGTTRQISARCARYSTARGSRGWTHIILRGATHVAALALYALPPVRLHSRHHYRGELQAGGVACVGSVHVCHFTLPRTLLLSELR